jgi:hypothetical protein
MIGAIATAKAAVIAALAATSLLMAGEQLYGGGHSASSTTEFEAGTNVEATTPVETNAEFEISAEGDHSVASECSDTCLAPCAAFCADPQGLPPLDGAVVGRAAFSAEAAPEQSCDCPQTRAEIGAGIASAAETDAATTGTGATTEASTTTEIEAGGDSSTGAALAEAAGAFGLGGD